MTRTAVSYERSSAAAAAPRALIDYDFRSAVDAPPKRRIVLWLMAGLVVAAGIALSLAKIDIVVSANGRIVTRDSEIVIQPLETSIVRSLAVRMGQQVKAGQVIATLDPTFTGADESAEEAKLRPLQAACDRIAAELGGAVYEPSNPDEDERTQRDIFRRRRDEYAARIAGFDGKIAQYQADLAAHQAEAEGLHQQILLAARAEQIFQVLVAKELASQLRLIDATDRRVELRSRLATNLGEQQKLTDEITATRADREAFIDGWKRKLAEEMVQTRADRDAAEAELAKAKLRHRLAVLRAPRDATVLSVASRPQGAVVHPAEPLVWLVPAKAPLVAEIEIDTRDVARVHIGDPVTVKLEALPWQQYGLADGVLQSLAPDTGEDAAARGPAEEMAAPGIASQPQHAPVHYRGRVVLTRTRFRNLPPHFALRPGMRLVADIKIGSRPILRYVLSPLTQVLSESLHEP